MFAFRKSAHRSRSSRGRAAGQGKGHQERPDEVRGMMATPQAHDYSILIADDDTSCRQALRDIMEPEGFRTLLASSGEEALDIVREADVHLALLDMHMPTL